MTSYMSIEIDSFDRIIISDIDSGKVNFYEVDGKLINSIEVGRATGVGINKEENILCCVEHFSKFNLFK